MEEKGFQAEEEDDGDEGMEESAVRVPEAAWLELKLRGLVEFCHPSPPSGQPYTVDIDVEGVTCTSDLSYLSCWQNYYKLLQYRCFAQIRIALPPT